MRRPFLLRVTEPRHYLAAANDRLLATPNNQASRRARAAMTPESPVRKQRAAPGSGTAANCAVPFKLNCSEVQGNPDPDNAWVQLRLVKAFVEGLNVPVALPPMFNDIPLGGRSGPVNPAERAVRSAVMTLPLVLLLGTGFGPLVNNCPVKVPNDVLMETGGMMFGNGWD